MGGRCTTKAAGRCISLQDCQFAKFAGESCIRRMLVGWWKLSLSWQEYCTQRGNLLPAHIPALKKEIWVRPIKENSGDTRRDQAAGTAPGGPADTQPPPSRRPRRGRCPCADRARLGSAPGPSAGCSPRRAPANTRVAVSRHHCSASHNTTAPKRLCPASRAQCGVLTSRGPQARSGSREQPQFCIRGTSSSWCSHLS